MKKNPSPITGAKLKANPAKMKTASRDAASVALSKTKEQQKMRADQQRKKTNKRSLMAGAGAAIGVGAKMAYDAYHTNIKNQYHSKYPDKNTPVKANQAPYGASPTNRELRKWKKGQ
jgi:hypothetical protein